MIRINSCRRCGKQTESLGVRVAVGEGVSFQWVKCTSCELIDGVFSTGSDPSLTTISDLASAQGIVTDFQRPKMP